MLEITFSDPSTPHSGFPMLTLWVLIANTLTTLCDSTRKSRFPADFAEQTESTMTRIRSARGPRERELGVGWGGG